MSQVKVRTTLVVACCAVLSESASGSQTQDLFTDSAVIMMNSIAEGSIAIAVTLWLGAIEFTIGFDVWYTRAVHVTA